MLVFFLIVFVIIQVLILDVLKRCLNQLFDSIDSRKSHIDSKESRRSTLVNHIAPSKMMLDKKSLIKKGKMSFKVKQQKTSNALLIF